MTGGTCSRPAGLRYARRSEFKIRGISLGVFRLPCIEVRDFVFRI